MSGEEKAFRVFRARQKIFTKLEWKRECGGKKNFWFKKKKKNVACRKIAFRENDNDSEKVDCRLESFVWRAQWQEWGQICTWSQRVSYVHSPNSLSMSGTFYLHHHHHQQHDQTWTELNNSPRQPQHTGFSTEGVGWNLMLWTFISKSVWSF